MGQGTRVQFGAWLAQKKHLTHTAYSGMSVEVKKAIYDEYRKSLRKEVPAHGEESKERQKEG